MKMIRNPLALAASITCIVLAPSLRAGAAIDVPPKVGDKAPMIEGTDQDGKKWKLSSEIGKNAVLLYFYPKDNTPGCTKEACGLRDRLPDLKSQSVDVVGVSFDTVDSHKNFTFRYDLNFTLIADPDGKIANLYGARMADRKMDRRISFLIGYDGRVVHVTDSPNPDVHLEEMQNAIKALKKN